MSAESKRRREVLVYEPGRPPFLRREGRSPAVIIIPTIVGVAGVMGIWALMSLASIPYLLGLGIAFALGSLMRAWEQRIAKRFLAESRNTP